MSKVDVGGRQVIEPIGDRVRILVMALGHLANEKVECHNDLINYCFKMEIMLRMIHEYGYADHQAWLAASKIN